jgi:hypothetical protein
VEVQREVVVREDLAERHRCQMLGIDDDVAVVEAQLVEGPPHEPAERSSPTPLIRAAECPTGAAGDRHVGRAAAEERAERHDVLQPRADPLGTSVDPTARQGQDAYGLHHGPLLP